MGVAIAVWWHPLVANAALRRMASNPRTTIRQMAQAADSMGMELHIRLHEEPIRTGALQP